MPVSEFKPKRSKKYEENYAHIFNKNPSFIKRILEWFKSF